MGTPDTYGHRGERPAAMSARTEYRVKWTRTFDDEDQTRTHVKRKVLKSRPAVDRLIALLKGDEPWKHFLESTP